MYLFGSLLVDKCNFVGWGVLIGWRWALVIQETLALIIFHDDFPLYLATLATLSATEECPPDKDDQVSNNHADEASSNSNDDTNL
jgi:hypothetical protein